jgi:diguanylate cyclase (GGDEF)-like protein
MSELDAPSRPPMILIANDQEWSARSLESILGPSGYAVLRATNGRQAIELARTTQPDLVILDERMPDLRGTDVCRILRDDPRFGAQTPLLLVTADVVDREQQLAALRAGAWDVFGEPVDAEALLLKIGTWVRAKRTVDRMREESLLDASTGLYNMRGLARRAREIGAEAYRNRGPVACVALAPDEPPAAGDAEFMEELVERLAEHLGKVMQGAGRASDAIGRLGRTEFGIVAPATEAAGAIRLVERLQDRMNAEPIGMGTGLERQPVRLRAGYCAIPDYTESPVDAVEMLLRAAAALRHVRSEGGESGRIQAFDELPVRFAR